MLSLSDNQMRAVMEAAASIDPAKRSAFLERCAAMLNFRMVDDAAVREVVARTMRAASRRSLKGPHRAYLGARCLDQTTD